ncbi:MAG: hypothetical protein UEJ46_00050 [Eggerthellaceae bacterium]|nr:hypothetical protein [Eggerthellaceae bacterium]
MSENEPDAISFRQDFPALDIPSEELIGYKRTMSEFNKTAKTEAKPDSCYICGKPMTSFCNSHTIPQYCLKEIDVDGKLLTTAALIGGNLIDSEVGIAGAATFKRVCRQCDSEYFKLYETPETLLSEPTSQVLGQIAAKNLLREISKGRLELGLHTALGERSNPELDTMMAVRAVDMKEDEKAFKTAVRVGGSEKPSKAYHLVYYKLLPYVVPFAFQQMISPMADFNGGLINNSYNPSTNYRMEPIHICILPSKGATAVLMFRSENANRYRKFEQQFRSLSEQAKLLSTVKLVFAYSEDVLLSKKLPQSVLKNEELTYLARMNHNYFGFANSPNDYKKHIYETALEDYAINNLPDPPNLLLEEYALGNL